MCGLVGFVLFLAIVSDAAGFWGVVFAFVIASITFAAAPGYALVKWGSYFPLLVSYEGMILAGLLNYLGAAVLEA